MRRRTVCVLALAGVWALFGVGCARKKPDSGDATVSGTVKYNGAPARGAKMTLIAPSGAFGKECVVKADGTFSVSDLPLGRYTVTIVTVAGTTDRFVVEVDRKDLSGTEFEIITKFEPRPKAGPKRSSRGRTF